MKELKDTILMVLAFIAIACGSVICFVFLFAFAALFAVVAVALGLAFSPAAVVLVAFHKGPLLVINTAPAAKDEATVPTP